MHRIKLIVLFVFAATVGCFLVFENGSAIVRSKALDIGLDAPTSVTASDNDYSTKVGLHWDTIRGATAYRIFRNTTNTPGTATDIGTTPANYFFDTTGNAGQAYYYWVRAENGTTVSPMSTPDQGTRAVGQIFSGAFAPLDPPPAPAGNPVTAAKAYLGKALFWDEQMSSTRTVSCGTCHRSASGGTDPRTAVGGLRATNPGPDGVTGGLDDIFGSPGVPQNNPDGTFSLNATYGLNEQVTGRKAPSYLNSGYSLNGLFWDGRATDVFRDPVTNEILLSTNASLESQAAGPPVSPAEMGHTGRNWPQVATRIAASRPLALASNVPAGLATWISGRTYSELFQEAFGTPDVTPARIAMAIATHERTLFSDNTPLDRSLMQIETLTTQETNGMNTFIDQACIACHNGPLLSDHAFHNIGVRPQTDDLGHGTVSGVGFENGTFKTPTLRNVELRAPFMHNGRFAGLTDVVDFYNNGGDFDAPNVDHSVIHPLGLTPQQKADVVAFLKRPLTDLRVKNELPPFDRPQLYTESNRVPVVSGAGRAGTAGMVPNPVAIEPPLVGNPNFTVAVSNALGGALAVLVIDSADPGVGSAIPAAGSFARISANLGGAGGGNGWGSVSLAIPNNAALVGQTFYGRWYVSDAAAANGFSVSTVFRFTVFAPSANRTTFIDLDGDRKTDISIFRPGPGEWWYQRSSDGQNRAFQFGSSTDKIVPADYTGDGKTDVAFFRPSTGFWYVMRSEDSSFYAVPFGTAGDVPVPADYDGDGKADIAVFRPSTATWYILKSSGGVTITAFGTTGDIPQVADYDGDGKADIAIFRPNGANGAEWWISRSTLGLLATQFGAATDKPVAADFTGDGRADVAFWRPSTGYWYVLRSDDFSYFAAPFGANGDIASPGDYDGDGRTDLAVFRPSSNTWYVNRSTLGVMIVGFGAPGDQPLPAAYVP